MRYRRKYCRSFQIFRYIFFSIFFSVLATNVALAIDSPWVNLNSFFENIFRVKFQEPAEISGRQFHSAIPDTLLIDQGKKTAPKLIPAADRKAGMLSCSDISIKTFRDWYEGYSIARFNRWENSHDSRRSNSYWPSYSRWNSPVFANTDIRSTFFMRFISARVSVAILGNNIHWEQFLNLEKQQFLENLISKVQKVEGYGYKSYVSTVLYGRSVKPISREVCDGFTILTMEIEK